MYDNSYKSAAVSGIAPAFVRKIVQNRRSKGCRTSFCTKSYKVPAAAAAAGNYLHIPGPILQIARAASHPPHFRLRSGHGGEIALT